MCGINRWTVVFTWNKIRNLSFRFCFGLPESLRSDIYIHTHIYKAPSRGFYYII